MIWLIRHTKRLLTKQDKWVNSKRYKENNVDMPITNDGKEYVKQAVIEMIRTDKNFDKIEYIYCSPMTRCIQTAMVLQDSIKKLTKKWIPLKIEYGLKELHVINYSKHKKYKNGKVILQPTFKNEIALDKKLHIKCAIKKYGKYPNGRIDPTYKSIHTFSKATHKEISHVSGGNKTIKTVENLLKKDKSNNFIICSHAMAIIFMYTAFTKKIMPEKYSDKITGKNWASMLAFKRNKSIHTKNLYKLSYGPTSEYWQKNKITK